MAKKPAEMGTAEKFVEVALREADLKVVEGPKDNQTKYGAFTGANFVAWCGSFVIWCANQAGFKLPGDKATIYTPNGAAAFKKAKRWFDAAEAKPEPGDVVYFDFPGDGVDRISHVGIVIKDNGDGTITTVEGNTAGYTGDQRNGGMVLKQIRGYKKNKRGVSVSVVGFGRPVFPGPEKALKPKAEVPSDPAAYPNDPIQPGEVGEYVKVIQKALGFTGKDADGQYGPVTKKAVIAWQKSKGYNNDGVIDKKQFAALQKLVK